VITPDQRRESGLATCLNNLSNRLGGVGRREEALPAIAEAAQIRRQLADQRPEVHSSELDNSLQVPAWLSGEPTDQSTS
jgi:hypothetical protein